MALQGQLGGECVEKCEILPHSGAKIQCREVPAEEHVWTIRPSFWSFGMENVGREGEL